MCRWKQRECVSAHVRAPLLHISGACALGGSCASKQHVYRTHRYLYISGLYVREAAHPCASVNCLLHAATWAGESQLYTWFNYVKYERAQGMCFKYNPKQKFDVWLLSLNRYARHVCLHVFRTDIINNFGLRRISIVKGRFLRKESFIAEFVAVQYNLKKKVESWQLNKLIKMITIKFVNNVKKVLNL